MLVRCDVGAEVTYGDARTKIHGRLVGDLPSLGQDVIARLDEKGHRSR